MEKEAEKERYLVIKDHKVIHSDVSTRGLSEFMKFSGNSHHWYCRNFRSHGNHFLAIINNEVYGFQKVVI